jgi:hypothetical protein
MDTPCRARWCRIGWCVGRAGVLGERVANPGRGGAPRERPSGRPRRSAVFHGVPLSPRRSTSRRTVGVESLGFVAPTPRAGECLQSRHRHEFIHVSHTFGHSVAPFGYCPPAGFRTKHTAVMCVSSPPGGSALCERSRSLISTSSLSLISTYRTCAALKILMSRVICTVSRVTWVERSPRPMARVASDSQSRASR